MHIMLDPLKIIGFHISPHVSGFSSLAHWVLYVVSRLDIIHFFLGIIGCDHLYRAIELSCGLITH